MHATVLTGCPQADHGPAVGWHLLVGCLALPEGTSEATARSCRHASAGPRLPSPPRLASESAFQSAAALPGPVTEWPGDSDSEPERELPRLSLVDLQAKLDLNLRAREHGNGQMPGAARWAAVSEDCGCESACFKKFLRACEKRACQ